MGATRGRQRFRAYAALLHAEHKALNNPVEDCQLDDSVIDGIPWTGDEKNHFFAYLARLGCLDIHGIAAQIPTKSTMECYAYLKHLRLASNALKRDSKHRGHTVIAYSEIPAAVELSDEWIQREEEFAAVLERNENEAGEIYKSCTSEIRAKIDEKSTARNQTPNSINMTLAKALDNLNSSTDSNGNSPEIYYNLLRMLQKSSNAGNENPEISRETLDVLHSSLLRLLKRIISTTLFVAQIRIRTAPMQTVAQTVRREDVQAAIRILALPNYSNNELEFEGTVGSYSEFEGFGGRENDQGFEIQGVDRRPEHISNDPEYVTGLETSNTSNSIGPSVSIYESDEQDDNGHDIFDIIEECSSEDGLEERELDLTKYYEHFDRIRDAEAEVEHWKLAAIIIERTIGSPEPVSLREQPILHNTFVPKFDEWEAWKMSQDSHLITRNH